MTESPTKLDEAFILAELEQAYLEGDLYSLIHAVMLCHAHARPLPQWVAMGVTKVLLKVYVRKGGLASWFRNYKHARRWEDVKRLREMPPDAFQAETGFKKSWANTYEAVAQIEMARLDADAVPLDRKKRDKLARGELVTGDLIQKSYQKVRRELKAGKGARYFARYLAPIFGPYSSRLMQGLVENWFPGISSKKVGRDLRTDKGARYFALYLGPYLSRLELGKKTPPNSSLGK
ncbi:MAG: hypothetical protein WA441_07985 [Methyloceanibacter sp.]